jgi:hypothetical protein
MARYEHLPIYKASLDMAVYIEQIVANFSRYHKFTLGSELRTLAHRIVVLVIKANNATDKRQGLAELLEALEEMKILVHIAKEVKAFHGFNSFETCVRHLDGVTRQCSGWLKSQAQGQMQSRNK